MRIFVTGVNGQLGHDVMLELKKRGHEAIGSGSGEKYTGTDAAADMPYCRLDVTDPEAVSSTISRLGPDAVIHCSAWTAVDAAEDEANRARVRALNVTAPGNIARVCADLGAGMVYLSTDYVFSGNGERPWEPDETDFAPLNQYGLTKLEGERAAAAVLDRLFIVRTSWVYGSNGKNFVKTMLSLGKTHDHVRVVDDQIGTPTYTADLARLLADMTESEKYGCYHASNEGGYVSWCGFAREIFRQAGMPVKVEGVTTEQYGLSKAARPRNSRLDKSKLRKSGFEPLPDWRDALARFLKEIGYGTNHG